MNKILIICLGLILSSCSSQWWVKKAMEKAPESFKADSIVTHKIIKEDTTIYLDVPIFVELPRDTLRITVKSPCGLKSIPRVYKKNGIIHSELWVEKNEIHSKSWLDSVMYYRWRDSLLVKDGKITHLTTKNKQQTIIIKDQGNELKWYEKWFNIGKYIATGLILLFVAALIIRIIKFAKRNNSK